MDCTLWMAVQQQSASGQLWCCPTQQESINLHFRELTVPKASVRRGDDADTMSHPDMGHVLQNLNLGEGEGSQGKMQHSILITTFELNPVLFHEPPSSHLQGLCLPSGAAFSLGILAEIRRSASPGSSSFESDGCAGTSSDPYSIWTILAFSPCSSDSHLG